MGGQNSTCHPHKSNKVFELVPENTNDDASGFPTLHVLQLHPSEYGLQSDLIEAYIDIRSGSLNPTGEVNGGDIVCSVNINTGGPNCRTLMVYRPSNPHQPVRVFVVCQTHTPPDEIIRSVRTFLTGIRNGDELRRVLSDRLGTWTAVIASQPSHDPRTLVDTPVARADTGSHASVPRPTHAAPEPRRPSDLPALPITVFSVTGVGSPPRAVLLSDWVGTTVTQAGALRRPFWVWDFVSRSVRSIVQTPCAWRVTTRNKRPHDHHHARMTAAGSVGLPSGHLLHYRGVRGTDGLECVLVWRGGINDRFEAYVQDRVASEPAADVTSDSESDSSDVTPPEAMLALVRDPRGNRIDVELLVWFSRGGNVTDVQGNIDELTRLAPEVSAYASNRMGWTEPITPLSP